MAASDVVGSAVITIGADTEAFDQEATRAAAETGQRSGTSYTKAFGGILAKGAKVAGAGIAAVLGASFVKGFTRLSAIDDAQGKLRGLGYSAKEITAIMNNATASVKGTAFGLGDAASQAANLVASGIKPGKDLTRTLKLLGDTSAIAGLDMGELGGTFQEMAVEGKLTGEALDSIQGAGIPVVSFLSKTLGKSMKDVTKDVSEGKISFNQFQTAMEAGLGGAAVEAGQTFGGAMKNVSAALGRFGAAILGGVFAKLPALFADAITWLDRITPAAKLAGASLGGAFSKAFDTLMLIVGSQAVKTFFTVLASIVMNQVVPAISALVEFGGKVVNYFKEHSTQAKVLAGVMGALYTITVAHGAVLAYQAGAGLLAYIKGLTIVANVTKVWTALQWALNIALNANPISLIILGLVALGAALFIAYKKSDTFRAIVDTAWKVVKASAKAATDWIVNTAVPWLVGAWKAISGGVITMKTYAVNAWNTVWNALKAVASWIGGVLGPIFRTWLAIVTAVFKAVQILILAWWKLVIVPTFNAVMDKLRAVGALFTWWWKSIVTPVFNAVSSIISAAWNQRIKPIFAAITSGVRALADRFTWFWRNAIVPVMNGVAGVISSVWNNRINPVFSAIKSGVGKVKDAFGTAIGGIRSHWDKLKAIASAPVRFMIGTVLNGGLIKAFNWLGSKVGGPHIGNIPMPFANGGVTPGYTPGRDVHQFYSPTGGSLALSGGEAIMRPEFTRLMGGKRGIDFLNKMARAGKLTGDFMSTGSRAFASGGVVDWIKKQPGKALNWVGDKGSSIWNAFQNPLSFLTSKMAKVGGSSVIGDYANAAARKLASAAAGKAKSMFSIFNKGLANSGVGSGYSGIGGGSSSALVAFGRWLQRQGYSVAEHPAFGGVAPVHTKNSAHYSGRAIDVNRGAGTSAREQAYLRQIIGPAIRAGFKTIFMAPGHFNHAHIQMRKGGIFDAGTFDTGGMLRPGMNLVRNNTGANEHLSPTGSGDTYIEVTISVDDLEKMTTVSDFVDMLKNSRAVQRKTRRSGTVTA